MKRFLEVIPGVCISTRRIASIEVQEHKDHLRPCWLILVFTDIIGEDGKPISYLYNDQVFSDREAALIKLAEIVGKCGGADA